MDIWKELRDEGVDSGLLDEVRRFREAHPLTPEAQERVPVPKYLYYGREVWESAAAALLCGLVYHKTKNLLATVAGEVFGTSVLGGLCAYPVAIFLMGKSAGDIAFYAYIVPFLISTAVGAVIAGVLVYSLQRSGALRSMQNSLS